MNGRFTIPAKTLDGRPAFPLELLREFEAPAGEMQMLTVRMGGETCLVFLDDLRAALLGLDWPRVDHRLRDRALRALERGPAGDLSARTAKGAFAGRAAYGGGDAT